MVFVTWSDSSIGVRDNISFVSYNEKVFYSNEFAISEMMRGVTGLDCKLESCWDLDFGCG